MKIIIEIDTELDNACIVGEALRAKFWDQTPTDVYKYGRTGCYSSFDYNADVEVLPERIETFEDTGWGNNKIEWKRAQWQGIVCEWYWDGDGTIRFILPHGILSNSDCKKDDYWEWE